MAGAAWSGVADHPALDLLNTRAMPQREEIELLATGQDFLGWLHGAGLVDERDRDQIAVRFAPDEVDEAAEAARRLREWLRPTIAAWAADVSGVVPTGVTRTLGAILDVDSRYAELSATRAGALVLRDRRRWTDSAQLLVPLARSAADLFATGERELVRQCEGAGCTLWFYDRTKARRRRWCRMAVCGNRAKARAHRARVIASS